MNHLRFFFMAFSLVFMAFSLVFMATAFAEEREARNFLVPQQDYVPEQNFKSDSMNEIQREEKEEELDSFGEDEFNTNVNPDAFEVDKELNNYKHI